MAIYIWPWLQPPNDEWSPTTTEVRQEQITLLCMITDRCYRSSILLSFCFLLLYFVFSFLVTQSVLHHAHKFQHGYTLYIYQLS